MFILPIGAAAAFAFFAARSGLQAMPSGSSANVSRQTSSGTNGASAPFDRAKWNALVQYDKDISTIAQRLQPLGQKWLDEFASSYLALNDKSYLLEIENKIVLAAKAEAEENERFKQQAAEQHKIYLQEQERRVDAQRKQVALWKDRLWGTRPRQLRTSSFVILAFAITSLTVWWINAPIPVKPYMSFTTDPVSTTTFSIWLWKEGRRYVGAMKLAEGHEGVGPLNELANVQLDEKSGHLSFVSNLQYCIRDTPQHVSFDGTVDVDKKLLTGSLKSSGLYFDNKSTLHQCCDDAPNFRRYSSLNEWRQSWGVVPTECLPR